MDAFEARLKAHIAEGKRVVFRGFGSFSRGLPAQKTGRNPRTGKPITYTAYHKPKNLPAVGETTLRNEIAADAKVSLAEAGRALAALRVAITTSMSCDSAPSPGAGIRPGPNRWTRSRRSRRRSARRR